MKNLIPLISMPMLFLSFVLEGQTTSPVDARIEAAKQQVTAHPKSAAAFNDLAAALIRKGRDYRDPALYAKASAALEEALKLAPDNYDARKLQVAVLLGMNEPMEALKQETALNKKLPDDIAGWGLLVDANVALGSDEAALKAAQWILDLRPGSSLGFEKAADLRELHGDAEGAVQFLDEASRRTSQNDADQRAWLLTQKARLILAVGNTKAAAASLDEAMKLFPDSQLALAGMARVRMAEGNKAEAAVLLGKRYQTVKSAANLYDWAEALANAGQAREAAEQFNNFEKRARAEQATLPLIHYYEDRKSDAAEALALSTKAAAERNDPATLDAYAWALYRNSKFSEARIQMEKALAVGVRDAVYFCHAAQIESMAKDKAAADRYSKEVSTMPGSTCAPEGALQTARGLNP